MTVRPSSVLVSLALHVCALLSLLTMTLQPPIPQFIEVFQADDPLAPPSSVDEAPTLPLVTTPRSTSPAAKPTATEPSATRRDAAEQKLRARSLETPASSSKAERVREDPWPEWSPPPRRPHPPRRPSMRPPLLPRARSLGKNALQHQHPPAPRQLFLVALPSYRRHP